MGEGRVLSAPRCHLEEQIEEVHRRLAPLEFGSLAEFGRIEHRWVGYSLDVVVVATRRERKKAHRGLLVTAFMST